MSLVVPTVAYRLSRTGMEDMEQHDPALASGFRRFIVRILAARVDFANREIACFETTELPIGPINK